MSIAKPVSNDTPSALPIIHYFRPALGSLSGYMLHDEYGVRLNNLVDRIVHSVGLVFAATIDLAVWTYATLTFYHVQRIGFFNHLANLTSSVAGYFFAFAILFGYKPKVALFRPVYNPFLSKTLEGAQVELLCKNENSEYVRECLDSGRRELVKKALDTSLPDQGAKGTNFGMFLLDARTTRSALSLGFDPNIPNAEGQTALLATFYWLNDPDGYSKITNLFELTKKVDPRLQKPIHVDPKDQHGLDAISYALIGIMKNSAYGGIYTLRKLNPETLYSIIETLVQNGAILPCLEFEEYRDFLKGFSALYEKLVQAEEDNPEENSVPNAERALRDYLDTAPNKNNPLARLVTPFLQRTPLAYSGTFLPHAEQLVQLKPRIEALCKDRVQPTLNTLTSVFQENENAALLGGATQSTASPIAGLMAEYAAGSVM